MTFHLTEILHELNRNDLKNNDLKNYDRDNNDRCDAYPCSPWNARWGSAADVLKACLLQGRDQITSALARMRQGVYGSCLKCGKEIDLSHLDAVPWLQLCIVCQEKREAVPTVRAGTTS